MAGKQLLAKLSIDVCRVGNKKRECVCGGDKTGSFSSADVS